MVQSALQGAQGATTGALEGRSPGHEPPAQFQQQAGLSPISPLGGGHQSSSLLGASGGQGATGAPVGDSEHADVLSIGEQYLGTPYQWGGSTPNEGFDCSGLVQYTFKQKGIDLPRTSKEQSKVGSAVGSLDQAQPGDLVYWEGTGGRPNHIGIYAGNGKMLEAPNRNNPVRYRDITEPPDTIRRVN